MTTSEIGLKLKIPKDVVKHILFVLGKTHDSLPYSDETIVESDEDKLVDDMLLNKSFSVLQKYEKKDWKATEEKAEAWDSFKNGALDPFERFLEKWSPPKYVAKAASYPKTDGNEELLVGISDLHFGLFANSRYLYNQKEWNIEETTKAVAQYADDVALFIRAHKFPKVRLLILGDILHTLSGFTDKGTKLEANPIGEEQLERAFDSLVKFIETVLVVSKNVVVHSCNGNHSSLGDYVLARMLELYFKSDSRIKFDITNKRNIVFKAKNSIFLMEHGYSAVSRDRLPAPGKARENYINNLFLAKPDLLQGTKYRYYLSADQHHSESYELTNVEGFMFPTLVGGCRHGDNSGYKSRPRQTCLIVNDEGVSGVKHFYFD